MYYKIKYVDIKGKDGSNLLKINCGHRINFYLVGQPMEGRRQQIMGGV